MDTQAQYANFILPVVAKGVEPVVIQSALGRTVTGIDGRTYLDCFSGISVVNAGHNHPRILAAAKEQMEKLVHCCSYVYHVPVVGQLSEQLESVTPGALKKSFFCNSGAEANEGAMRLAKQATGRHEFLALGYSFHGRTIGTLSITGNASRKKNNGPYLPGIAFAPTPYCYRCPLKLEYPTCDMACAHAIKDTIQQQTSGDVAAMIVEPILGEGGIVTPGAEYFKIAASILHDAGALLIVDEVQTGFGRTGKMFGIEHYDVAPDIMTMAKGIASGFPLGAFIAREPVCDAMQPGDHLSTFGGNPISCAAALANLAVIRDEQLIDNSARRGEELSTRLRSMQDKHAMIGDVRGKGLMIGVELVRDRKSKEPADREAKQVRAALREQGVLVGVGGVYGNVVRFQPPLSMTASECEQAATAFESVLKNF
jgi:4-aminobutyrate aminotransferase / (S)-3-amino-2-methylpropionate transaminase / 5-aminovalerate transaminase